MSKQLLLGAAVLALVGHAGAMLEASLVHSDDGCVVETHCNVCLLQLRAPGVVTVRFSPPLVLVELDPLAPAPLPLRDDAAPRRISSRGPPSA